jgi:cardiolipin synthase
MPDPHTLIVEPDDGRSPVLQILAAAKSTIDLTIYEIGDPQIMAALTAAAGRGVAVRVLYNWYSFSPHMQQEVTTSIATLTKAGVQCKIAPKQFENTHEKTFVIDGATAIVMSFNLTSEYFVQSRDFGIVTTVAAEVAEIAAVFNADWNGQSASPSAASLVWSPENSRTRLMALINSAKATLDVYCEEVDDPGSLQTLVATAKRGVAVRFIAAVMTSEGKINANARGVTFMNAGGVNAVCKDNLYMHAKMVLADFAAPTAKAFVGSENFSCESLNDNRECGIIVTEPAILQRLESTFKSDWATPSVTVVPDNSPLTPCPGNTAGRTSVRVAQRSVAGA